MTKNLNCLTEEELQNISILSCKEFFYSLGKFHTLTKEKQYSISRELIFSFPFQVEILEEFVYLTFITNISHDPITDKETYGKSSITIPFDWYYNILKECEKNGKAIMPRRFD